MSTLAQAAPAPATHPAESMSGGGWAAVALLAVWSAACAVLMVRRHWAHRPSAIAGPDRLPPRAGIWPIWVAFGLAWVAWVGATIAYGMIRAVRATATAVSTRPAAGEADVTLSDADLAMLSTAGPVVAFVAAMLALALIQPGTLRWIGFHLGGLPRGVRVGLGAALVVVPWTYLVSVGVELAYQWVDFKHPSEHDLLRVMKENGPLVRWTAVVGAVLVAPVWEELLFRGLFQTAATEWLVRQSRPRRAAVGFPVVLSAWAAGPASGAAGRPAASAEPPLAPEGSGSSPVPPPPPLPLPVLPLGGAVPVGVPGAASTPGRWWRAWLVILVTATLFALVHDAWTRPIIFFLAVALGYCYERTGNLWVSVTVHALFNASSTALALSGAG